MRSTALGALLLCAAALPSCDACAPPPPPTHGCEFEGTTLGVGTSGVAADGCNTCLCTSSLALNCTTRLCTDAGPDIEPSDAGPDTDDAGVNDAGPVDEGPCHDSDSDSFYNCLDPNHPERQQIIDCDDGRFHVQPGGFEFSDTPEDDNCNGTADDWSECGCSGASTNATDLAAGLDICGDVLISATKTGGARQFGLVDAYQGVIDERLRVRQDDPSAAPVIMGNSCLTTLSTGDAVSTEDGVENLGCSFQDPDPDRVDQDAVICDLAKLELVLRVPWNARGFAFDFMFLSYEWPEYLCLEFNDTFYSVVETPPVNTGEPTNAAFDTQHRPITVNVGFFENPTDWTVPLDGISHAQSTFSACSSPSEPGCQVPLYCNDGSLDPRNGSGSGWLTTTVPVQPGQQDLKITMSVHDEGDQVFDSIVLLDAFRWLPFETELQTAKEDR